MYQSPVGLGFMFGSGFYCGFFTDFGLAIAFLILPN